MENKTWTYADRYRHIKEVKSAIRKKADSAGRIYERG